MPAPPRGRRAPYRETVDPEPLIADLDADQRSAVTTESTLVAVIAGAGSGKTRVLTRRIAYRIATGSADARHTLALTFTREAAGELRRRLRSLGLREHVEAGTFHSVMLGLLRQRLADTDRPPMTVLADRRRLVGAVLDSGDRRGIDDALAEIDWAAARGTRPDDYARAARRAGRRPSGGVERAAAAVSGYAAEKRRRGVVDFDDVLAHTLHELRSDASFADATRWRFRHLLVDEAQDLDPLQHQLVDELRDGRNDLFLVGDPAQAIYGFNGADPTLLVDVDDRFPGVEILRLPVNHRCTPQIVDAGVHVLGDQERGDGLRSDRADGVSVTQLVGEDEHDEARLIATTIARCDPGLVRSGQVAVLARTRAQLAVIEAALQHSGVAVREGTGTRGSALQLAVQAAAANRSASHLRAWAHDTLEDGANEDARRGSDADTVATARVAAAVLEFLREHPLGDGAGFRSWVATTDPFDDPDARGVELLTFHAAKGREWFLVVVSGVETGLVPHRSATTAPARAEEARLLYVAFTRATDQLVVSRAERRGGYRRKPSPFVERLRVGDEQPAPPPPRRRAPSPDPVLEGLRSWRERRARQNHVLPGQLMSDRDLAAIAAARPTTPEELVGATTLGPITAGRLAPELAAVIERSLADAPTGGQSSSSTITGA